MKTDKDFLKARDIQDLFDVSRSKAYKIITMLKERYEIEEDRLPVHGCIPTKIVKKHFNI